MSSEPSLLSSRPRSPAFADGVLRRRDLDADPLRQFARWFEAARRAERDAAAMTLATVGADGAANARTVSLKDVDGRGFVFTSAYGGPKAREIDREPRVALTFYWPSQGRQVRVTGRAERLPDDASERYFAARTDAMKRAVLAHPPSAPVRDRAALEAAVADLADEPAGETPPAPGSWGGYLVWPATVEFWQGRADRLHDRFRYRSDEGGWAVTRLAP